MKRALSIGKAAAALAIIGAANAAYASPLSYSLQFYITGGSGTQISANPSDTAGAFPVPGNEWNTLSNPEDFGSAPTDPIFGPNSGNTGGTFTSFADSSGNTLGSPKLSGGVYAFNEPQASYPGGTDDIATAGNNALFSNGFFTNLGTTTSATGGAFTLALTSVPYASYDVYIYFSSTNAGGTPSNPYSLSDNNGATYFAAGNVTLTSLAQATATTSGSATPGDFAEFTEAGPSVTFTLNPPASGNIFVTGMQIVQVTPEPATLGILGVAGSLALLRRRRRADRPHASTV
jgi:hypothetical protein